MFRSKFFGFALLASVLGNPAQAENIYLNLGDSIVRGHDVIYCGVQSPPILQSATSKTCGRESGYDGTCLFFEETTITGRYCAEGQSCGRISGYDGKCIYFNQTAACGDHSCSTQKKCGKVSGYDGSCIFFNLEVTCW